MSCIQNWLDPDWVKSRCKGRTPEQSQCIRYLALRNANLGCLKNLILKKLVPLLSDEQYDKHMYDLSRVEARALSKLGITKEQVQEIQPVCFQGYDFYNSSLTTERKEEWVADAYQVSLIFFSDSQLFFYQYNFSSVNNEEKEYTEEFFYKDIIAFSSNTERVEVDTFTPQGQSKKEMVSQESFKIKTAAGSFGCTLKKNDLYAERRIKEMRELLRTKKG